jgi:hypothetical protein
VSENWVKDVMLGIVITVGTILAWAGILALAKREPSLNVYLSTAE